MRLRRFSYSGVTKKNYKTTKKVMVPAKPEFEYKENETTLKKIAKYELNYLILHTGNTLNSGHFKMFDYENKFVFDDTRII